MKEKPSSTSATATQPVVPKPLVDSDELKKMLASSKDSSDYWQGRWHLWQAQRQKIRGKLTQGGGQ